MNGRSPVLATRKLTIGYHSRCLLNSVCLSARVSEFICLVGANGAGKSTLIRTLAGLDQPQSGQIIIQGTPLKKLSTAQRAKKISLGLTDRIDLAWMSVQELVSLGRYPYTNWQGRLDTTDHRIVEQAIAAVGLDKLAAQSLNQISDGERQKAMIARALAQETPVMLLDEPTAYLDILHRVEMMQLLRQLAHHQGRTIIMSTHDLELALRSADTLWLISPEGELLIGTPEELAFTGALSQAFQSERFHFDQGTGQFQLHSPRRSLIQYGISRPGVEDHWTLRTLERLGFEPTQANCPLQLRVEIDPNRWIIKQGDHWVSLSTLGELSRYLQALQWED